MPKRRAKGDGSIHAYKNGFRGYLTVANEIVDGVSKRRRRYVFGDTIADVKVALAKLHEEAAARNGALSSAADRTSLGQYLKSWIAGLEVRPNTKRQYEWIVTDYLEPRLGTFRLDRLGYHEIEAFRVKLIADGIGDRTRQLCHDVLRIALKRAVRAKILASNPIEAVERPRAERKVVDPWTAAEAKAFLLKARTDRFHAMYEIMLRLGPQFPGEVLGLRWDDIDLKKRTMRIGAQLETRSRKRAATKRDARRRVLDLPAPVVTALVAHRERLLADGLRSSPWVFPSTTGTAMNARNLVRDSFDPLVELAGVRRIRPYDMRHTFATLALIAGVHIKTVSRMLGHSDVTETLRTYSHFVPSQVEDANLRVGALLGDTKPRRTRAKTS